MERPARVEGRPVAVRIQPSAERHVREGHPWVFEGSVTSESRSAHAGEIAVIFDRKNRFLAAGLYDPAGPIRVRIFQHGEPREIGPDLFRERLGTALALRTNVASEHTTGLRVIHGENDRMPGLVADLYGRSLVLQIHTAAWLPHLSAILPVFHELLAPERILLLASRQARKAEDFPKDFRAGAVLYGTPAEGGLPFLETGLRFEAHPLDGHKTGFYLDQRENRRRLEREVSGGRVLNVFSYSGAFSLYAARGGADEAVSVDRAAPALKQARRHFELNGEGAGVQHCRHRTLEGDAFEVMAKLADQGKRYDVVVVDPPSFATAARHRDQALGAYRALTTLALALLPSGGLLVQASCSARVPEDDFYAAVAEAARSASRPLHEVERTGHPADHPVGFPEGAYLKCLWARAG